VTRPGQQRVHDTLIAKITLSRPNIGFSEGLRQNLQNCHSMRLFHLPVSLLWLVVAQAASTDDGPRPTAVRKMSPDDGEKFFPDYYAFSPSDLAGHFPLSGRDVGGDESVQGNASLSSSFEPPFAPLENDLGMNDRGWELFRRAAVALARLQKRQWVCPGGTSSCASIGFPFSCCRTGQICYRIPDTGLGPVGCCNSGSTCGGTISFCGQGDTACPSDLGGGCCLQGFVCRDVGCKWSFDESLARLLTQT
jgi:hypothetical protein